MERPRQEVTVESSRGSLSVFHPSMRAVAGQWAGTTAGRLSVGHAFSPFLPSVTNVTHKNWEVTTALVHAPHLADGRNETETRLVRQVQS